MKTKLTKVSQALLGLGLVAGSAILPGSAYAEELEEIVIVGTRVEGRSVEDSVVPVDVLDAGELLKSGAFGGEVSALLNTLVPSFNFSRQSNSDSTDIIRPAQLRGLSPDQTLVLVNGKRRHTTAMLNTQGSLGLGSAPVDLNTIPSSAIKRIEVLRDGAAAQYGSDAIAGVINIVLNDADEGGSVSVTYGAHVTDVDPINDSVTDGETVLITANHGFKLGENGFINLTAQYRDRNRTNRAGVGDLPFFENFSAPNLAVDGQVLFLAGDPEEDGYNIFANWGTDLNGMELYGNVGLSKRTAIGSNFFRYPDSSANVIALFPRGFVPLEESDVTDSSFAVGLKGEYANDWKWDLSLNYGSNEFDRNLNSVNSSLGAASPTRFHVGNFEYAQATINYDVSKATQLGSIPVNMAFGAEYRDESYDTSAGDAASIAAGPIVSGQPGSQGSQGLRSEDAVDASRDAFSLYGDFEFDLSDRLRAGLAVRYEDYSDFGDTATGKLSARYELTDSIALRSAISTGFRAPSLVQSAFQTTTTSFGPGGTLVNSGVISPTDPLALAVGSQPLDAEESDNFNLGFIGNWDNGLSFSVDFYRIDIDDRITLLSPIFADASGTPVSMLPGAAARPGIQAVQFLNNVVDTETEGVDVILKYQTGSWEFSAAYNDSDTEVARINTGASISNATLNNITDAAPENKLILSSNWTNDKMSVLLRATRYGETKRVFDFGGGFEPTQTFGSDWSVDTSINYLVSDKLDFTFSVLNIFDEYPDIANFDDGLGYFGHFPYDVLPGIGFNGRYVSLKANYSF